MIFFILYYQGSLKNPGVQCKREYFYTEKFNEEEKITQLLYRIFYNMLSTPIFL